MELTGGNISDAVISSLGVMTDGTGHGRAKRWHTRAHDRADLIPANTITEHFCAADSFAAAEE